MGAGLGVGPGLGDGASLGAIQRALSVGHADDPFEIEAEETARRVVEVMMGRRTLDPTPTGPEPAGGGAAPCAEHLHRSPSSWIARVSDASGRAGGDLEPDVAERVHRARSTGGSPLGSSLRRRFEDAFEADLSGVRIHRGDQAGDLSNEIGAKAFTLGSDIFLGRGQGDPSSEAGLRLLGHELTHTLQQGGGIGRSVRHGADVRRHPGAGASVVRRKPIEDPKRPGTPFHQDDKHPELKLKQTRKTETEMDFQIRDMLQPLYWRSATEDAYYTDPEWTKEFDVGEFKKTGRFGAWIETYQETREAHKQIDKQVGLDPDEAKRRKDAISMYLLQRYITNALYRKSELELLDYQASPLNFQENSQYLRSFATSYVKALQATIGENYKPNKVYLTRDASFRDVLGKFFEVARLEDDQPPTDLALQQSLTLTIEKAADFLLTSDKDLQTYWEASGNPQAFVDVTPAIENLAAKEQQARTDELGALVRRAFMKGVAKKLADLKGKDESQEFRDELSTHLQARVDVLADAQQTESKMDAATRGVDGSPLKGQARQKALAKALVADQAELSKFLAWLQAPERAVALTKPKRKFIAAAPLFIGGDAQKRNDVEAPLITFISEVYDDYLASKRAHVDPPDRQEGTKDAYDDLRSRIEKAFETANMAVVTGGMVSLDGPGYQQSAVMVDDPAMQMAVKTAINKSGSVPTPTDSVRKLLGHQSLADIVNGVLAQQSENKKALAPHFREVQQKLTSFEPDSYTSLVEVEGQLATTRLALVKFKEAFAADQERASLEARAAIKLIEGSDALRDDNALPAFVLKQLAQHMEDAIDNQARIEDHVRSIQGIHEAVILALELDATDYDENFTYGAPQHSPDRGKDPFFQGAHITDYGLKAFSQAYDAAAAQVEANGGDRLDLEAFYNIYFELSDKLSATRNATKGGKVKLETPTSVKNYLDSPRFASLDVTLKGVDVIMVDIHPNDATKEHIVSNEVTELIEAVFAKKVGEDDFRLTVMIDITLNHPGEDEVGAIREAAEPHIKSGRLNLVFVESLAKFSQLGMDKHSGGLVFSYNDNTKWADFNKSLEEAKARDTVDPTIHKYFQALFRHAETEQKEYLQRVRANTKEVHTMLRAAFDQLDIAEDAIEIARNDDDGSCYVALRYDEFTAKVYPVQKLDNFEEMHHFNEDVLEKCINKILHQTGLPVAMRFSFGFPVSNLGETGKEIRFTIGIEGVEQLQKYVDVLAYVNGSLAKKYEAQKDDAHTGYPGLAKRSTRASLLQEITDPIQSLTDLQAKLSDLLKKKE